MAIEGASAVAQWRKSAASRAEPRTRGDPLRPRSLRMRPVEASRTHWTREAPEAGIM